MNKSLRLLAQVIRDYMTLHLEIQKAEIIIVLGSRDIRVADRWIELLKQWYAPLILFSWGLGSLTKDLATFSWTSEADVFAKRAIEQWISPKSIIIENQSTNTWQNINYSFEKIKNMNIQNIILVQKPYMERRTFATFAKQRPNSKDVMFTLTSPQIPFSEYYSNEIPLEQVINIMVWDLQRIIEYPKLWFQIEQDVPEEVLEAYHKLIALGFTKTLIKK